MQEEYNNIYNLAIDFRSKIKKLPLDLVSESPANAVTTLRIRNKCAGETIEYLKMNWACLNRGKNGENVSHIAHIGYMRKEDNEVLSKVSHEIHDGRVF